MSLVKRYRSQDGAHYFTFRFQTNGSVIDVYCLTRPSLNGRNPHPTRTHLFKSSKICLVDGREPRDERRASDEIFTEPISRPRTTDRHEASRAP